MVTGRTRQRDRVLRLMRSGGWWTLQNLQDATGDPQPSISARLREFRRPEFGGYDVQKVRLNTGLYEYRLKRKRKALVSA